jgi:ribosomal protein S18 acetylase RimI-like enzyme
MTLVAAVDAARFRSLAADAAAVYGEAMRRPPEVVIQRRDVIGLHVTYAGFVAAGAFSVPSEGPDVDPGEISGHAGDGTGRYRQLVGFGYGYLGAPGQWWHDIVARGLGRTAATRWLADSFELAELHVRPDFHGQGLGRALLSDVLSRTDASRALLSTPDLETPARGLYRSAGFVDLLVDFRFPGSSESYAIMGVDL